MIENYTDETLSKTLFTSLLVHRDIEKHTHVFWEFTYTINGDLTNYVNDKRIDCQPLSQVLLIKPGDTHRIEEVKSDTSTDKKYRDIYVFPEKMKNICDLLSPGLYDTFKNSKEPIVIDTAGCNFTSLEQSLLMLQNNMSYSSTDMQKLGHLHTSIVCHVLGFYLQKQLEIQTLYPDWITDFFNNLKKEEYLCKDINEIIKDYHYSHGYICREFKKHVGKTMIQCINESRINFSTTLLMNRSLTILEIAMRLNYNSQSAYINAFKQIHNVSPNKWRKQHLNI